MKTEMLTRRTYEAPETSVDLIEMEQCILSTAKPGKLDDMDPNDLYDEDF
ncbi:MAG: hypothetical protein IJK29_05380 [Bacteroidales bacterium]|nr:hypothetical protein [Bacteroidales bacterium]